jgi:hypothetical protein
MLSTLPIAAPDLVWYWYAITDGQVTLSEIFTSKKEAERFLNHRHIWINETPVPLCDAGFRILKRRETVPRYHL